jgi:hypothetical protein
MTTQQQSTNFSLRPKAIRRSLYQQFSEDTKSAAKDKSAMNYMPLGGICRFVTITVKVRWVPDCHCSPWTLPAFHGPEHPLATQFITCEAAPL